MTSPLAALTPEALQQHDRWLRSLTRQLVRDPDIADDVAQEVWAAACDSRIGKLRPWMRKVARTVLQRRAERETYRARIESERARPEAEPSADDAIARIESGQRVVAALLELPEPYKTTVALRFFEDLPPRAIAARMRVPVETVRTRLKRALAQMRTRLDQRYGSRMAWIAPFLGTVGLPETSLAFSLAFGATMKTKLVAALSVAAVASLVWFGATQASTSMPEDEVSSSPQPLEHQSNEFTPSAKGTATTAKREVVNRKAPRRGTEKKLRTALLTGRCVTGPSGQRVPVAGVTIRVAVHNEPRLAVGDPRVSVQPPEPVVTGTDGTFTLRCPTDGDTTTGSLKLDGGNIVPMSSAYGTLPAGTTDFGDVVVRHGCQVHGTLHDRDGRPIADTRVRIGKYLVKFGSSGAHGMELVDETNDNPLLTIMMQEQFAATTRADGSFAFPTPIPAKDWKLDIYSRRRLLSDRELSIPPGTKSHTLTLIAEAATRTIRGRVAFDRRDLKRMPRLTVKLPTGKKWSFFVPDDGQFEIEGFPRDPKGSVELKATARYHDPVTAKVAWNDDNVLLTLPVLSSLRVRVRDASTGQPVTQFGMRVFRDPGPSGNRTTNDTLLRYLGEHEGGIAEYRGLRPGAHLVTVEAEDPTLAPSWFLPCDVLGDGRDAITVELGKPAERHVRVVTEDGKPVAGVTAEWVLPLGTVPVTIDTKLVKRRYMGGWSRKRALLLKSGKTDGDGSLRIRGSQRRDYALRVHGKGIEPKVVSDIELTPGLAPVQIVVTRGATIRGVVRNLESDAKKWPTIRITNEASKTYYPKQSYRGKKLDKQREFAFLGLPAGSYRVEAMMPGRWKFLHLARITVGSGGTQELTLDGHRLRPAIVTGVLTVDGQPVKGLVQLLGKVGPDGSHRGGAFGRTDEHGRFRIESEAGRFRPVFETSGKTRAYYGPAAPVELRPGDSRTLNLTFQSRPLHGRLLQPGGKPAAGRAIRISHQGTTVAGSWLTTDKNGAFQLPNVPAGDLVVSVWPKHLTDSEAQREHRNRVGKSWRDVLIALPPVRAKGTTPVLLRLPK